MISIVIPCFNEEAVLPELFRRLTAAAEAWEDEWEVICVDDGSRDGTWPMLVTQHQADSRWRAISLARNFGHQVAISCGLAEAVGEAVIIIDADLQDPPEELHRFIAKWREGYEVVYAIREKRKEGILKRSAYWIFYRLMRSISEVEIPLDSGDFCIMDRQIVDLLVEMRETNRFLRGLRAWAGFRQIGLTYERQARAAGDVKYTFRKLIKLAIDGMFSFSILPLRLATYVGLVVSTLSALGAAFTLVQRLFAEAFGKIGLAPVPGFATIVISILFLGGVQLLCLGILGEYVGRIYEECKRRPLWTVKGTAGIERADVTRRGT